MLKEISIKHVKYVVRKDELEKKKDIWNKSSKRRILNILFLTGALFWKTRA